MVKFMAMCEITAYHTIESKFRVKCDFTLKFGINVTEVE